MTDISPKTFDDLVKLPYSQVTKIAKQLNIKIPKFSTKNGLIALILAGKNDDDSDEESHPMGAIRQKSQLKRYLSRPSQNDTTVIPSNVSNDNILTFEKLNQMDISQLISHCKDSNIELPKLQNNKLIVIDAILKHQKQQKGQKQGKQQEKPQPLQPPQPPHQQQEQQEQQSNTTNEKKEENVDNEQKENVSNDTSVTSSSTATTKQEVSEKQEKEVKVDVSGKQVSKEEQDDKAAAKSSLDILMTNLNNMGKFGVETDDVHVMGTEMFHRIFTDFELRSYAIFDAIEKNRFDKAVLMFNALTNDDNRSEIVNTPDRVTGGNETLLEISFRKSSLQLIKFLLENGADPNIRGTNVLTAACFTANLEGLKMLKLYKFDYFKHINNETNGETPFSSLCSVGAVDCIKFLLQWEDELIAEMNKNNNGNNNDIKKMDIFWENSVQSNALHTAAFNNHSNVASYLVTELNFLQKMDINHTQEQNATPLHIACQAGNLEMIKVLMTAHELGYSKNEINVNIQTNSTGETCLHLLCKHNHYQCIEWFLNRCQNGKNIQFNDYNCFSSEKDTPLMTACSKGSVESAITLCQFFGGDSNVIIDGIDSIVDSRGNNSLAMAALYGHVPIFMYLILLLIKKYDIKSWDELENKVINDTILIDWISTLKSYTDRVLQVRMRQFLIELKDTIFKSKSFVAFLTMLNVMCPKFKRNNNSSVGDEDKHNNSLQLEDKLQAQTKKLAKIDVICSNVVNECKLAGNGSKNNDILSMLAGGLQKMIDNNEMIDDALLMLFYKIDSKLLTSIMIDVLKKCVGNNEITTDEDSKNDSENVQHKTNVKLISWFKQCIAQSLVLSMPVSASELINTDDTKDNDNNNNDYNYNSNPLLFDIIDKKVIQKQLKKQQLFIKNNIFDKLRNANAEKLNELINYKQCNIDADRDVKQTSILNRYNEKRDLMIEYPSKQGEKPKYKAIQSKYEKGNLFTDYISGFNASEEYDLNSYLTDLLINANILNPTFQSQCKEIFSNESNTIGVKCKYKSAPIKTKSRCQIKTSLEYNDKESYPNSSYLLDILRCSVTFDNIDDYLTGMKNFQNIVGLTSFDGVESQKGCFKVVTRIKNMFENVKNWTKLQDYSYCDIKFNVLIEYQSICMVGEVQFILKSFLDAKK